MARIFSKAAISQTTSTEHLSVEIMK